MYDDPFNAAVDELAEPPRGSVRPLVIGLAAMLGIGVLSAMVLIDPPMARSMDVTDEERLARMLALPPAESASAGTAEQAVDASLDSTRTGAADATRGAGATVPPVPASAASGAAAPPGDREARTTDGATAPTPLPGASHQLSAEVGRGAKTDAEPAAPTVTAAETGDPGAVREVAATVAAVEAAPAPPRPSARPASRARPAPPPAPPVPEIGQAADGPYAVQFGAMSTREAAERETARLRLAAPALFARVETSIEATRLDDGRTVHRMRIGGVTRKADARAWCRAFRARGGACYVIG